MNASPLENHLGYWLRCLSNFVSGSFAARLERHGTSVAQWVVMRVLYDHDSLTLNECAHLVGVDKSSLSRMIERLVQKKLITRTENETDRRAVQLQLSPAGRKLVPMLAHEADDNDHEFFKTLSASEKKQLMGLVQRLLADNGWDESRGADRLN
ncbi:MAG TPA: MarR family transcriptional regulator [Rhodospirillaceae bacterium]|nr:MarR family transcriptional regulator [Rhodospirillaceae bacterium]